MDTSVESTIEEAFAKCAEGDAATVGVVIIQRHAPSFAPMSRIYSTPRRLHLHCDQVLGYIDNHYNTFGVKVTDDEGNTALLATAKGISGSNVYKYQVWF